MDERGSVSVEFVGVLPVLAVCMLLVAQVGSVVAEQLTIQHAAREGARAAATSNDDERARDVALSAGRLDPERATITVTPEARAVGEPVTVTIEYRPLLMPISGSFVPAAMLLRASASMHTERAPP